MKCPIFRISISKRLVTTGVLLLSREMAVNEALSFDRNRFLVKISNSKKFGSFDVFVSVHM